MMTRRNFLTLPYDHVTNSFLLEIWFWGPTYPTFLYDVTLFSLLFSTLPLILISDIFSWKPESLKTKRNLSLKMRRRRKSEKRALRKQRKRSKKIKKMVKIMMRSIIMMIHQNIPQLKLKTADQKRVKKIRNNAEKLSLKPNRNCLIVVELGTNK